MKTFETLSEAITNLKKRGYENDFNLHPEWIECTVHREKFKPDEFHVDEFYRFEGMTDPDDSTILFAISSNSGLRGLLVDAYGMYSNSVSKIMLDKLRIDNATNN